MPQSNERTPLWLIVLSGVWVIWWTSYIILEFINNFDKIAHEPNIVGDFFAGIFAPLAFAWLAYGYFMQRKELELNRLEYTRMVENTEYQAKIQRSTYQPEFSINSLVFDFNNKNEFSEFLQFSTEYNDLNSQYLKLGILISNNNKNSISQGRIYIRKTVYSGNMLAVINQDSHHIYLEIPKLFITGSIFYLYYFYKDITGYFMMYEFMIQRSSNTESYSNRNREIYYTKLQKLPNKLSDMDLLIRDLKDA